MATSVERLLVTAKVDGDEYLKLKAERRILLLRFGSTLQAQQVYFQERGGLAACLVTVENELLQLEAKYGGPLAFGKWLNDSARKRMDGKRAELRLQLRALRRIVELEDVGDDEGPEDGHASRVAGLLREVRGIGAGRQRRTGPAGPQARRRRRASTPTSC